MRVIRIYKNDDGEKEWVKVVFKDIGYGLQWLPKLEEIAMVARLIYEVEDNKYPDGKGGEMVREFLSEALDGFPIIELSKKYLIPNIGEKEKFEPFNTSEI